MLSLGASQRLNVGACSVDVISDGFLLVDGAGLFENVPSLEWHHCIAVDESGAVELAVNSFLIRTDKALVLVDTGFGLRREGMPLELTRRDGSVLEHFGWLGIDPEAVNVVVNTHLHLDHAGGNLVDRLSLSQLAFPNARYVVQAAEVEFALSEADAHNPLYRREDIESLKALGHLDLIDGATDILRGGSVRAIPAPGHTPGHQMVVVESNGQTMMLLGDIAPLKCHLERPEWCSSIDQDRETAYATKQRILASAVEKAAVLALSHDPEGPYEIIA